MNELDKQLENLVSGHYWCDRVWKGWEVGTMKQDDFTPSEETELVADLKAFISQREEALLERLRMRAINLLAKGGKAMDTEKFIDDIGQELRNVRGER